MQIPPQLLFFTGLIFLIILGNNFFQMDLSNQIWRCSRSGISLTHNDRDSSISIKIIPGNNTGNYQRTSNKGSESGTWKVHRGLKGGTKFWLESKDGNLSKFRVPYDCAKQAGFGY